MIAANKRFYRIVFEENLANVLAPVRNPEGRFHHGGQAALYTSATPEGARLALGYYAKPADPPRLIVELNVVDADLFDLRDANACAAHSISYSNATVRWQNERAEEKPATPWQISDIVRKTGADGMIYPSSTRAEVFHMVLFRWNEMGGAMVRQVGLPYACVLN
ncbi:MAG: RES family NAD+ phosphorylase [Paracoccaceae bacterium]